MASTTHINVTAHCLLASQGEFWPLYSQVPVSGSCELFLLTAGPALQSPETGVSHPVSSLYPALISSKDFRLSFELSLKDGCKFCAFSSICLRSTSFCYPCPSRQGRYVSLHSNNQRKKKKSAYLCLLCRRRSRELQTCLFCRQDALHTPGTPPFFPAHYTSHVLWLKINKTYNCFFLLEPRSTPLEEGSLNFTHPLLHSLQTSSSLVCTETSFCQMGQRHRKEKEKRGFEKWWVGKIAVWLQSFHLPVPQKKEKGNNSNYYTLIVALKYLLLDTKGVSPIINLTFQQSSRRINLHTYESLCFSSWWPKRK